ncbi:DUF6602 domain-containing protein [Chloroflexota bacterium]
MLENHLNALEEVLCAQGKIASNAGHPNLIGNPKEWFIRNFLMDHLPETVKIGQGEIINSRTVPKESRNQSDIVLYRQDYPVISYSQDNNAFMRESVIATIEVKSTIYLEEFRIACKTSINHKERIYIQEFDPNKPYQPAGIIEDFKTPPINTYVVAYDGPVKISTAATWLPKVSLELEVTPDKLVDLIVILGKGTVWRLESFPPFASQLKTLHPEAKWGYIEQQDKNLLILFLHLLFQISPIGNTIVEYAKNVPFRNVTVF